MRTWCCLPPQWGEMNLTSINGERRLRLYERFMDPPGEAIPDWAIAATVSRNGSAGSISTTATH